MKNIMAAFSNESGDFVFSLADNAALNGVSRVSGAGYKTTAMLHGKPRQDIVGGSLDRIELKGVCYGADGGSVIQELFDLKASNLPVVYVRSGQNQGVWTIKQVRANESEIMPNGASMKTSFSVQLEEFAND